MSNNKQSMKLYTEEQVKEIYFKGVHNGRMQIEGKCSDEINLLTPIELPSDEEISIQASNRHYGTNFKHVYASGAKWMKEQILGKEDKTFKQKSKWTKL